MKNQAVRNLTLLLLTLIVVLVTGVSHAAVKYWDVNGATAGSGATATGRAWDTTTANWSIDPAGLSAATTFTAGDIAVFFQPVPTARAY